MCQTNRIKLGLLLNQSGMKQNLCKNNLKFKVYIMRTNVWIKHISKLQICTIKSCFIIQWREKGNLRRAGIYYIYGVIKTQIRRVLYIIKTTSIRTSCLYSMFLQVLEPYTSIVHYFQQLVHIVVAEFSLLIMSNIKIH